MTTSPPPCSVEHVRRNRATNACLRLTTVFPYQSRSIEKSLRSSQNQKRVAKDTTVLLYFACSGLPQHQTSVFHHYVTQFPVSSVVRIVAACSRRNPGMAAIRPVHSARMRPDGAWLYSGNKT